MKNARTRWRLTKRDVGLLAKALKPIRSCREVGEMMGVSWSVVYSLENSALRKVANALHDYQKEQTQTMNPPPTKTNHE